MAPLMQVLATWYYRLSVAMLVLMPLAIGTLVGWLNGRATWENWLLRCQRMHRTVVFEDAELLVMDTAAVARQPATRVVIFKASPALIQVDYGLS